MEDKMTEIMELMSVFGKPESSFRKCSNQKDAETWMPATDAECCAFTRLTKVENRTALKAWYRQCTSIDPMVDLFRRTLERAIKESLPLDPSGSRQETRI